MANEFYQMPRSQMITQIDAAADVARLQIAGDSARLIEYTLAESQATAYKAAGYTGSVPISITIWADAKGWTAQEATDDILSAADAWRAALIGLRQARLLGKEKIRQLPALEDGENVVDTAANAIYDNTISAIKNIVRIATAG